MKPFHFFNYVAQLFEDAKQNQWTYRDTVQEVISSGIEPDQQLAVIREITNNETFKPSKKFK